jgi:peptidoglycan pentaglycine glycine transferase (the first glycine)
MAIVSLAEWDTFLSKIPNPHILQTSAWGQLKADFGWQITHVVVEDCGAQILIKRLLPGVSFAYIPKGPVGQDWDKLWPAVDAACREKKCAFLKIEPDAWESDDPKYGGDQPALPVGFSQGLHSIQPLRTLVIDLTLEEAQILGRMKQKTRYNINLAHKKNVIIKPQVELDTFYELMKITGQREQFGIHSLAYYRRAYELFHGKNQCQLLLAESEAHPISGLIAFRVGNRAWYFYGASSNVQRDKMPNYLLQWEAMRWAKNQGCAQYDLWGVPDADHDTLEANFATRSDGLWGVYRFKRGFGGRLMRSAGPWDCVYNPFLYRLYSIWLKYRNSEA